MRIQVVGAGAWGVTLARLLANNGHDMRLWGRPEDNLGELATTRTSPVLPDGVCLPESVVVTEETEAEVDLVVYAVASHAMRQVAGMHEFKRDAVRVSVAKGIETDTRLRMSEVIRQVCGGVTVVALSGPSHAEEVAVDLPATIVAAGEDETACLQAQEAFHAPAFRVYTSPDIVGVELGGALKNVIAVAAGACDGFGLGDNAKAALITRGLAEIGRLGRAMGAHPLTFAGLSGMGDLIVTCGSRHSRNRALGERLASGMTGEEAIAASKGVAEGARNAQSAQALSEQYRVEMPICRVIYEVLYEGYPIRDAVERLMGRRAKPEAF